MIATLTIVSVGLSILAVLMIAAIAAQRHRVLGLQRDRAARQERLRPLALMIVEGVTPEGHVDTKDVGVLAELVGRYSRQLRGAGRERASAFFAEVGVIDRELAGLGAPRAWRRATSAAALGDTGAARSIGALRAALSDSDPDVLAAAAIALGRLGAIEAIEDLTRLVAQGAVPHSTGAMALLEMGPDGLPAFEALIADDDPRMRATALDVIGMVGSATQTALPVACLSDDEPAVRRSAATALGRLADREAAEALKRTLIDPNADVRAAAATALGRIGDRGVADDLVHLACHDEFDVAHSAARALIALDPALVTAAARAVPQSRALEEAADLIAIGAA